MFRLLVYGKYMQGYPNHATIKQLGGRFINMYRVYGLRLYDLYLETDKYKENMPLATTVKNKKNFVMGEVYQFDSDKALKTFDEIQGVDHLKLSGPLYERINITDNTVNPLFVYIGSKNVLKKVTTPYLVPYALNKRWRPRDFFLPNDVKN